jgi:hypothetical protein
MVLVQLLYSLVDMALKTAYGLGMRPIVFVAYRQGIAAAALFLGSLATRGFTLRPMDVGSRAFALLFVASLATYARKSLPFSLRPASVPGLPAPCADAHVFSILQRDGAVLLLHGAASGVAVNGKSDHQPRPRHHVRHCRRHRVLLLLPLCSSPSRSWDEDAGRPIF